MEEAKPGRDTTSLAQRGEWLSAADISEVFGIGRTSAYQVMSALPHIRIGRSVRVHKSAVYAELRGAGGLPKAPAARRLPGGLPPAA